MFGIPKQVLVDNGPEFHGAALEPRQGLLLMQEKPQQV
jgi:hypothetical protein